MADFNSFKIIYGNTCRHVQYILCFSNILVDVKFDLVLCRPLRMQLVCLLSVLVEMGLFGSVPVGSRLIELLPMNSRDSSRLGLCSVVLHFGPIQFEPASSGIQRFSWWSYILIFQQNSSVWTCLAVWDPNQSHSCQEHTIWNYVKKCGVRCDHVKSIHCQSLQPLIDFFG